jgi:hypothetical protein
VRPILRVTRESPDTMPTAGGGCRLRPRDAPPPLDDSNRHDKLKPMAGRGVSGTRGLTEPGIDEGMLLLFILIAVTVVELERVRARLLVVRHDGRAQPRGVKVAARHRGRDVVEVGVVLEHDVRADELVSERARARTIAGGTRRTVRFCCSFWMCAIPAGERRPSPWRRAPDRAHPKRARTERGGSRLN